MSQIYLYYLHINSVKTHCVIDETYKTYQLDANDDVPKRKMLDIVRKMREHLLDVHSMCNQLIGSWEMQFLKMVSLGNGLVPSGNKPLSDSMLTQFYIGTCRHYKLNL